MIGISILEYALLYLCIRRWELVLFCFMQSVYMIFMFFALSIRGIIFPYYESSNISKLEEYADRKIVTEIIELVILLGIISIILIPVALYMCEYINYMTYVLVQLLVIPILLCIAMVVILIVINRIIGSKNYTDKKYKKLESA